MRVILFFVAICTIWSCAKPLTPAVTSLPVTPKTQPVTKEIQLHLKSMIAHDLQENVTFRDELLIQVNQVKIIGEKVYPAGTRWIYVGSVGQGQEIKLDTVKMQAVLIRPEERLGIQVSLWELDDYSKDQAFIHQLNQVSGLVQIPLTLLEWSSISNPVSWFLWGARFGSVGLDWWAKRDGKDLLGVSEVQWDYSAMSKGKSVRFKRGNWKGGKRGLGAYHYGFSYEIRVNDSTR